MGSLAITSDRETRSSSTGQRRAASPSRSVLLRSESSPTSERWAEDAVRRVGSGESVGTPPTVAASVGRSRPGEERAALDAITSAGRPLDASTRRAVEPCFAHDFASVRIHDDASAARAARRLGAEAFAVDRHLVFAAGRYAPSTAAGRALLTHELAHVVQQERHGVRGVLQRKASSIRFQEEATLEEVSEGREVLEQGDEGEAVLRVNIALSELGFFRIKNRYVPQEFYWRTTLAVKAFQSAKSLGGVAQEGAVDQPTFQALDAEFSAGHAAERAVLGRQSAGSLLAGTQFVDATESAAAARTISTEVGPDPVTGILPTFQPSIVGLGTYEDNLRRVLDAAILAEHRDIAAGKAAARSAPGGLFDWAILEGIAARSKSAVDGIFGEYTASSRPAALLHGSGLADAWEYKENQLKDPVEEERAVRWRVDKLIDGDAAVQAVDDAFGARHDRPAEAAIIDLVRNEMMAKHRTELLETHKAWPAFAGPGTAYVQRFTKPTDVENRDKMWGYFRTFIHEYIHMLEHPDFEDYRNALDEQQGGFVLREGTTEYFADIVWNGITFDSALRAEIEGPYHDPAVVAPLPAFGHYDEAVNAERLAGVVGIRNLAAAFFLGRISLIGG